MSTCPRPPLGGLSFFDINGFVPVQNYHPGESFRRYDLPVNVNTIHFKNLLLRKIVTKRPTGIIFQSRELLSRACKLSFVT